MSFDDTLNISEDISKELDLAQTNFDEQNYCQAIIHVGSVIFLDPVNQKALDLLKSILEISPVDIHSLSLDENTEDWKHNFAVITYTLGFKKDYNQALPNLTKLLLLTEETLYLYWLENWLADENFFKILQLDVLKKALVSLMTLPNQAEFNHNIREIYEVYLGFLRKAEKYYNFDDKLTYIMAVIARRCLQYHRSILIAAKSYGVKPSYLNTLALAYAYRELDDYDNTVKFFQEAIAFNPDSLEVKLNLADFICPKAEKNSDDYQKGIQLYKKVIDLKPNHSWAYPSYLYYSYVLTSDATILEQLEKFSKENIDNERAKKLLSKIKKKLKV